MAGFTDSALEKKLSELNNSQQSIQTLSLWLIHHRKHHKTIVQVWFKELKKAKPNRKLTFMYLANDVIQNSKKKGPEFSKEFSNVLSKAFAHVCECVTDSKTRSGLERIINVWEDRNVYDSTIISGLRSAMKINSPLTTGKNNEISNEKKRKTPERKFKNFDIEPVAKKKKIVVKQEPDLTSKPLYGDPPDVEELIKALQDLENCPSTDAVVREKIASLPPEVSDITLLEKIQSREAAEKLTKQVDEACAILADYNNRLSEELEDRKQVSKMLSDFTHAQREQVAIAERKVEEYKEQLKRVSQVRNELKSHLQNLPDLTLLPSVTGGLAPLPSAGDLFNQ
ncbi:regulation of nuclear pre-mRNA domain-containing protein 1B-like [Stegodyphus dumicola]|nr:regulation of nuclear pre-mRNA domain-containing protein 1B-like [Stegodyphus dumicola]